MGSYNGKVRSVNIHLIRASESPLHVEGKRLSPKAKRPAATKKTRTSKTNERNGVSSLQAPAAGRKTASKKSRCHGNAEPSDRRQPETGSGRRKGGQAGYSGCIYIVRRPLDVIVIRAPLNACSSFLLLFLSASISVSLSAVSFYVSVTFSLSLRLSTCMSASVSHSHSQFLYLSVCLLLCASLCLFPSLVPLIYR